MWSKCDSFLLFYTFFYPHAPFGLISKTMKSIEYPPAFVAATITSALVTICSLYFDKDATLTSKLQDSRRQVLSIVSIVLVGYVITLAYRNEIHKSLEWHSSPVDWCEKNYEVTPYVVEFWNTLSSSALCVGAIVATIKTRSFGKRESGWIFWNISFFCIGLGSIYFHATSDTYTHLRAHETPRHI